MDNRIALELNTPLCLCNDRGEKFHCVIESEIGRGGSCIVYEASRIADTGDKTFYRVKEFYPYKLKIIRDESNRLIPSSFDAAEFDQMQEKLRSDFSKTNQLFYSGANYSSVTNQIDIFKLNGTTYILSAYSSKKTLATYRPKSLKECVTLVKQVAYVLGNIHKQGYLYLDIKPDNVLVVDGYKKQVQLFDFDSLLEWKEVQKFSKLGCDDFRLSYSKGFAPIELLTSKIKRLGPHTDVYSIGALLFYLLFGYPPTIPNCETDAVYDFTKIHYDYQKCDDRLFGSLSDFFHNALAIYYADRYQNMQEVLGQLQKIEKYADLMLPRIYSTHITKQKNFYGREHELKEFDRLVANGDYNCLFITGMGGIGKSSFIREYLIRHRERFDTILYVYYKDSIEATISNDSNIEINTLRRDEEINNRTRYFDKKLAKIREIVRGTSSVLVIDNFDGEFDDDLHALLSTELKVILLSRKTPTYQNCQEMKLFAISDKNALRCIFEANLGRSIEDNEQDGFEHILKRVEGHTLVLELIAKQIANSYLTITSAAFLTAEHGFSRIAPEKVNFEKDSKQTNDTIGNIIDAIFVANKLSMEKKILMKVASLFGDDGIDINCFQKIMKLASKDDLNELINDGWLMMSGNTISMHNVICETVHRWEWTPEYLKAAERVLTYFYVEIRLESTKNNYPKKLRKNLSDAYTKLNSNPKDNLLLNKLLAFNKKDDNSIYGNVFCERLARIKDESPTDIERLTKLLLQAESIVKQCHQEKEIYDTLLFANLQFIVLLDMPQYREDYIFSETSRLFAEIIKEAEFGNQRIYRDDIRQDAVAIMKIYELVFSIYDAYGDKEAMRTLLDKANEAAKQFQKREAYAIYYDMVSEYYDVLLDGNYDTEDPDEELLLNKMLDAIEKTLHYSKRSISCDDNHLYAKNILAKATVLMRSCRGTEKEIGKLIDKANKIITENTSQYADVRLHYYLVCAWYFALCFDSLESADEFIKDARELSEIIIPTDLQKIEDVIIPCANIYFELKCHNKSIDLLYEGTRLCAKHVNSDSYVRIRQELYEHLWQVGIDAQKFGFCQNMIKLVEAENKEIVDFKNKIIVPEEIRKVIESKTT